MYNSEPHKDANGELKEDGTRPPGGGYNGGGGEVEYRHNKCPLCGEEVSKLSIHLPNCDDN